MSGTEEVLQNAEVLKDQLMKEAKFHEAAQVLDLINTIREAQGVSMRVNQLTEKKGEWPSVLNKTGSIPKAEALQRQLEMQRRWHEAAEVRHLIRVIKQGERAKKTLKELLPRGSEQR